jgi:hypothetical protein
MAICGGKATAAIPLPARAAMTSPRMIVSGATTVITRRTTLRKAFLSPWNTALRIVRRIEDWQAAS